MTTFLKSSWLTIHCSFCTQELGDWFEHFCILGSFGKPSFVLDSEAREEYSGCVLSLIKDCVLSVYARQERNGENSVFTSLILRMPLGV